jgi:hypothetical protein|tara:strand:+ start:1599 stop:1970 length:372 start_codon:yes stop_codon:yes gene_type:complete
MITDLEQYQNQITDLPNLEEVRYENIFKVAKSDKFFFYNIIKKITIPEDLQSDIYYELRINSNKPWTTLSHDVYGTQDLWWLICLVNNIFNPIDNPELGAVYKIIRPDYVNPILAEIKRLTNG